MDARIGSAYASAALDRWHTNTYRLNKDR